ncbi:Phenylalanyl-tRNA synthetase, class IIc, alpha subunit [mine drainage metagenome]|uniref:phenylalanine--tRNA ligase n=1 Tax=mine drainage metagenome TaxID=410659 RepID=T1BJI9_9ZZZZ
MLWDEIKGNKAFYEINRRKTILLKISNGNFNPDDDNTKIIDPLTKRNDVLLKKTRTRRTFKIINEGHKFIQSDDAQETVGELTPELLTSGKWKDMRFRKYDLNLQGQHVDRIGRHPLRYLIKEIREIFLEMGFTEMTGNYIESAGWNMDSLFIPQDHPAREMQDTFYLEKKNGYNFSTEELALFRKFGEVHVNGVRGYSGYGGSWNIEESKKMVLRTHTTPNTIRYLSRIKAKEIGLFSVEKVFRHESVDWKHLAEFHQIEGAVHSKSASLATLKWLMRYFYERLGFSEIRLVPSYYPYTEPSMDVVVKINGKDVEMGGSGIFRPEVTKPLGLKYPVMAWGLGLERLALIYYGLEDLRELYQSDINWLRNFKIKI